MNTKGFKQMLIGEKMPDKDDPKYKERYERDVRAGRKFAKMCRIDKAAAKVQRFADLHKTLFLVIVFGMWTGVSPKRIATRNMLLTFTSITQQ